MYSPGLEKKSFICSESQEVINIYNYQPTKHAERYKAQRKGLPIVLQIMSLTPDMLRKFINNLDNVTLCSGILEGACNPSIHDILIEKEGDDVVYRSRHCEQLVKDQTTCKHCTSLLNSTKSSPVKAIPRDDMMNHMEEGEMKVEFKDDKDDEVPLEDSEMEPDFDIPSDDDCDEEDDNAAKVIKIARKKNEKVAREFICHLCGSSFDKKHNLNTHLHRLHKVVRCFICDSTLNTRMELKKHLEDIHGKKTYSCHLCGKVFDSKSRKYLYVHLRKVHGSIKGCFPCTNCDKAFEEEAKLKQHMILVHQQEDKEFEKCPLCDEVFNMNLKLLSHVRRIHSDEKDNPIFIEFLKEKQETWKCDRCADEFLSEVCLHKHLVKAHGLMLNNFHCDKCGKSFRNKHSMRVHVNNYHDKEEAICPQCGVSFQNQAKMKIHLSRAHRDKFKCTACLREFQLQTMLNRHMRIVHLGERVLCHLCDKSVVDKRELKRHILTKHEGLKPFHCELCDYKAGRYGNLKSHRKITHKIEQQMKIHEFLEFIKDGKHPNCSQIDLDQESISLLC